jgi:hypothetical protein
MLEHVRISDAQLLSMRNAMAAEHRSPAQVAFAMVQREPRVAEVLAPSDLVLGARVAMLLSRHASDEEWIRLVREGALPDVPVATTDLEALRGGIIPLIIIGVYAAA